MADKLRVGTEVHDLKLGRSFENDGTLALHSVRYDFKPASMDSSKMSTLEVGEKNQIKVTVPHVEGSGISHTVYKGNKRPVQKECVLIIDHKTGEISIEKLNNAIQLKKTRIEGSSKANQMSRPLTPSEQIKMKTSPKKKRPEKAEKSEKPEKQQPQMSSSQGSSSSSQPKKEPAPSVATMSTSSSSDSESLSSDSDDDDNKKTQAKSNGNTESNSQPVPRQRYASLLREDLKLSDSGSDSDSD